jgi:hypothetical protein
MPKVCDSCLEVVEENYPGGGDIESATMFCIEMGLDIEDHDCDGRESNGEIKCDCQCNHIAH